MGDLPEAQRRARTRIDKAQTRQKKRHDHLYTIESYSIGEKVLRYKSFLEGTHKDKLKEKWEGPFYIHDVLEYGNYKLRNLDDKVLKPRFHGNRLKRYYPREESIQTSNPEISRELDKLGEESVTPVT